MSRIPEICDRLVDVFSKAVPGAAPGKSRKPMAKQDIESATEAGLQRFYAAAREEKNAQRLGVIAQARVAFGVQQRLLEKGYPAPLVKQVLFAMLLSAFVGQKR